MDDEVYGVKAYYILRDRRKEIKVKRYSVEMEACPSTYFRNGVKNINIEKLYCLSSVQTALDDDIKDMQINGRFDSEVQGKLLLTVQQCDPSKKKCKTPETRKQFLKSSSVAVYFLDHSTNLGNKKNPIQSLVNGVFTNIDTEFTKYHEIYLKMVTIETDTGKVFSNFDQITKPMMENQRESVSTNKDGYDDLYSLQFSMSQVE